MGFHVLCMCVRLPSYALKDLDGFQYVSDGVIVDLNVSNNNLHSLVGRAGVDALKEVKKLNVSVGV